MLPIDGLSQWKKIIWDESINTTSTTTDRSNYLKLFQILHESDIENGKYLQIQGRDLLQEMQNIENEYLRQHTEIRDQFENGIINARELRLKICKIRQIRKPKFDEVADFFLRHYKLSANILQFSHTYTLNRFHFMLVRSLHVAKAFQKLGDLSALQKIIFQNWIYPLERDIQGSDDDQKNAIKFIQSNALKALENM